MPKSSLATQRRRRKATSTRVFVGSSTDEEDSSSDEEDSSSEEEEDSCKSVPDFESVGAMWVDWSELDDWRETNRWENHFRDPQPLKMLPLVSTGKMTNHSIETQAFIQLEQMMTTWTAMRGNFKGDLARVSNALRGQYPADVFLRP